MKIRKIAVGIAAVVVLGALAATGVALAAVSGTRGHRGHGDRMIGRLVDDKGVQERLGLSADQLSRLRGIRDEARTSIRDLRAQAIKTRADLRAAMLDAKASRRDLERRAAEVRDSVNAISQEVTKRLLDARDVLSADQREQLRAIVRERIGSARRGVMGWRRHRSHQDGAPEAGADGGSADDGAPDSAPEVD